MADPGLWMEVSLATNSQIKLPKLNARFAVSLYPFQSYFSRVLFNPILPSRRRFGPIRAVPTSAIALEGFDRSRINGSVITMQFLSGSGTLKLFYEVSIS